MHLSPNATRPEGLVVRVEWNWQLLATGTTEFGQLRLIKTLMPKSEVRRIIKYDAQKIVKYQIEGPETCSQRKVSSSGGANRRKRRAITHWVHFRNFSIISYILINSLMVLRRDIYILKIMYVSKVTYNSSRPEKNDGNPKAAALFK